MRRGTVVSPITVGREDETQQLLLELEDARLGRGRLTVVAGEAGVGKSRVVADIERVAAGRGMVVLRGTAVDSGTPVAYRLIASAVLPAFRRTGPPDDPALGPYRSALSLLVPEWAGESRPAGDNAGLAVLEASGRLLRVLAGKTGLLVVLEDIHWADAESLAVLDYLAQTLGGERVLCLVTTRPEGEAGAARALLDRCSRAPAASVITLNRLPVAASSALIHAILGVQASPAGLDDVVRTNAEGVPLVAEELLAELIADGRLLNDGGTWRFIPGDDVQAPSGFHRLVERRLARLQPATIAALKAASLLGREFDWQLIAPISGLSESEVLGALAEAVDAQLLSTLRDPGRMQFRHALLGTCVAGSLLPPERTRLARVAAAAVEAGARAPSPERLELAADLWLQAGEAESACRLMVRLGADALSRGAVTSAVTTLERALSVSSDATASHVAVLELLSDALARAGAMDRCLEVTAALPAVLRQAGCQRERVHAGWIRLARAELGRGRGFADRGVPDVSRAANATRALDLADATDGSPRAHAITTAVRALVAIEGGECDRASALADEALSFAAAGASEAECEALYVRARAVRHSSPEDAAAALERALAVVDRDGVEGWRLRVLVELGLVDRATSGRSDRLLAARDVARERGEVHTAAVAALNLGFAPRDRPDWTEADARASLEDALELSRRHHLPTLGIALRFRAMRAALRCDFATFEKAVCELRDVTGGGDVLLADVMLWKGLYTEDRPLALAQLPLLDRVVQIPDAATAPFRGFYALLCAVAGREPALAIQRIAGSGYGMPINRVLVGMAECVVLGSQGKRDDATRQADSLPPIQMDELHHMAWRLMAEAAIRDGWGTPQLWLRDAHGFFTANDIHPPARACAAMLRSIGEAVARRGRGDSVVPTELRERGVTSREMDVLLLVRQGLSNNEIAERLFMSRRTVETHVSHLLAKLELPSRGRLAAQR